MEEKELEVFGDACFLDKDNPDILLILRCNDKLFSLCNLSTWSNNDNGGPLLLLFLRLSCNNGNRMKINEVV